jgi:hypothetical protein
MVASSNLFNNVSMITAKSLRTVRNNLKMASRVARRWDGDWAQSFRIGDTLNIRVPGFYAYRSGPTANPGGYNDTFVPLQLAQGGCDIELTSKELALNVDEFQRNVSDPLAATLWQQMDAGIISTMMPNAAITLANPLAGQGINQFIGVPGTPVTTLQPFVDGYAYAQTQSAAHTDERVSGMLNPHMNAGLFQGLTGLLLPSKEISEQYRNGSMGNAGGVDFYSTANAPSLTLGTWSGTILYASGASDGGNSIVLSGMTGAFNPGEHFTIAGVNAVNPSGKGVQAELKHFVVESQVGNLLTFSPALRLTGPLQNVNALPVAGAALYPWGVTPALALAAGTGQIVKQSLVFHEDAFALGLADLKDTSGMGGAGAAITSSRMKDDMSGLRCRSLFWYDGVNDKILFRLDVLWGANTLRQGFATVVVQ